MDQEEERLRERIGHGGRLLDQDAEFLFDLEPVAERPVAGISDTDGHAPQPSRHTAVGNEPRSVRGMDIAQIRQADGHGIQGIDDMLYRFLLAEDHHRFLAVLADGFPAEADEPFGFQDAAGVAFHARGRPGQVCEEVFENPARTGSGRKWRDVGSAGILQPLTVGCTEMESRVGDVTVRKVPPVAGGSAAVAGHLETGADHGRKRVARGAGLASDFQPAFIDKPPERAPGGRVAELRRRVPADLLSRTPEWTAR